MFFSDRIRRLLCFWLWLLLGVAPLITVVVWCIERNTWGVWNAAEQLSCELGLRATLDRVVYVRPGLMRLENLQLANPENGQTAFRCKSLDVTRETGRECLVLSAIASEVNADALDEILRTLLCVMQSRTSLVDPCVRLSLGDMTLRLSGGSQALTEVTGKIETGAGMVQSQMSFRLPNLAMAEPAKITITRNRQTSPPSIRFDFSTGGAFLPCSLLATAIPELGRAGPNSRFQGWFWASSMPDGWQGEASGQLSSIELDGLLRDWSSYRLSSTAELSSMRARFQRGRLEEAAGVLSSGPGVISRSLLATAIGRLGLTRGSEPSTPGEFVPYDQMNVAFLLNRQGLQVQGRCPTSGVPAGSVGSILVDRYGPLLCDPMVQPIQWSVVSEQWSAKNSPLTTVH